jgi:hypothetical protein
MSTDCRILKSSRVCLGHRGRGPPSRRPEDILQWNFHWTICNIKQNGTVWKCTSSIDRPCWPCPDTFSSPPDPPRKKQQLSQKMSPHQIFHHQCDTPGIDPIDKSPSVEQQPWCTPTRTWLTLSENPAKNHQESDSSKQAKANIPPPNATRSRTRTMSQDYPLTGPSPGVNQHTYPSSPPPVRWNLLSSISTKRHCFFLFPKSLNDGVADKKRKYHVDYNNTPPSVVSFIPVIVSTSGRLHSEFIRLLFLQTHRETGNRPFFNRFRSPVSGTQQRTVPLPPCGILCSDQVKMWKSTR